MIEDDLSRVEESATKSTYKLDVGFDRCEDKSERSAPKFISSSNYYKEEEALKPTKTNYPSNPKPSFNPKREVRKKPLSRERSLLFACFVPVPVTWISFAFNARGLRGGTLIIPETHIAMRFLIFCLALSLTLCLTLLLVFYLNSLMYLTIAHMVLVYEKTTLCLDALVTTHASIVVSISRIGLILLLEGLALTLS
jgi:hypothetical protein